MYGYVIIREDERKEFPKEFRRGRSKLFIEGGLLKYKNHDKFLMVAPTRIRPEILEICHSEWVCGHFGIFTSHQRAWWPTLYNGVVRYISDCEMCVVTKPQQRNPGKMDIRTFSKSPMELVSIDYLVELPMIKRGNKHILSINDQFMRFTQIYAVSEDS